MYKKTHLLICIFASAFAQAQATPIEGTAATFYRI
jgi:hypothetical protein